MEREQEMKRSTVLLAIALTGCPQTRDRGSCTEGQTKAGQECGPWGRWTERCDAGQSCLPGESCQPSAELAGDGPRWCAVTCGGEGGQAVCDAAHDLFGGRTACRDIVYPHATRVHGMLCADPSNGWGEDGNDPDAADGSGGG